jgi:hypothetical protein
MSPEWTVTPVSGRAVGNNHLLTAGVRLFQWVARQAGAVCKPCADASKNCGVSLLTDLEVTAAAALKQSHPATPRRVARTDPSETMVLPLPHTPRARRSRPLHERNPRTPECDRRQWSGRRPTQTVFPGLRAGAAVAAGSPDHRPDAEAPSCAFRFRSFQCSTSCTWLTPFADRVRQPAGPTLRQRDVRREGLIPSLTRS